MVRDPETLILSSKLPCQGVWWSSHVLWCLQGDAPESLQAALEPHPGALRRDDRSDKGVFVSLLETAIMKGAEACALWAATELLRLREQLAAEEEAAPGDAMAALRAAYEDYLENVHAADWLVCCLGLVLYVCSRCLSFRAGWQGPAFVRSNAACCPERALATKPWWSESTNSSTAFHAAVTGRRICAREASHERCCSSTCFQLYPT